ncbi:hypothetical protein ACHAQJ_010645 [Trichoderma viride]
MTLVPTLSPRALGVNANQPPAEAGPRYHTVAVNSYTFTKSVEAEDTIEVPRYIDSSAFLMYAGFKEDIATDIYDGWTRPRVQTRTLVQFTSDYVMRRCKNRDVVDPQDDWLSAFQHLGMNQTFCTRFFGSKFASTIVGEAAGFWVVENVIRAYKFLCSLSPMIESKLDCVESADEPPITA